MHLNFRSKTKFEVKKSKQISQSIYPIYFEFCFHRELLLQYCCKILLVSLILVVENLLLTLKGNVLSSLLKFVFFKTEERLSLKLKLQSCKFVFLTHESFSM